MAKKVVLTSDEEARLTSEEETGQVQLSDDEYFEDDQYEQDQEQDEYEEYEDDDETYEDQ